ncbi:MAG: ABC transporter permease [Hyphomonas sp.]
MAIRAFLSAFCREILFLRHSFWDRVVILWMPLLLLGLPAMQFSSGVIRNLPIIIVDQDQTQASRELAHRIDAAPEVRVLARIPDFGEAEEHVRARKAYVLVMIPDGAESDILQGGSAAISIFYNASYSTASGSALRAVRAAVQDYSAKLAIERVAAFGTSQARPAPVTVQTTILFNPQRSYEFQLVSLLHPALLHLAFMIAVTGALGRELRDGTIGDWLAGRPGAASAIAGKLAPYGLVFMVWGGLATSYLAVLRGWPIHGSLPLIMAGYLAMYAAYAGIALFIVGLTRSMLQSLSMSGLYAGASFAFAGAIFPIQSASSFAQFWSAILPYTWFAKLLSEQWSMASPPSVSLGHIGIMMFMALAGTVMGLPSYIRSASQPASWGRR